MQYKIVKSVARNFSHSFVSYMNYVDHVRPREGARLRCPVLMSASLNFAIECYFSR